MKFHFVLAFTLRVVLVIYSNFHDQTFKVQFTDIDYKVFTDASRYMLDGLSPFNRHTYRYSPLLAAILTPNIFLYSNYGKLLFSFVDILVAILIRKIVATNKNHDLHMVNFCAYLWLYNPLIIIISTRGNADCLAVCLVTLSLYFLECGLCSAAGLIHGLSIHFRLYPLAFSLAMYLSLRTSHNIFINMKQIKFTLTCLMSLTIATVVSYYLYGFKFIHESLIYHLIRKDTRHNFSVFFYTLYLSADTVPSKFLRIFNILPQLILLINLSGFYSSKKNLPFALMMQAFVVVIYNTIMTSQYFFWFLSLFPLCFPRLMYNVSRMMIILVLWTISQGMWLGMAYALEFNSLNSFNLIWLSSIFFFVINIQILSDLIQIYKK